MDVLKELIEHAGIDGVTAPLANEMIAIRNNYETGNLSREEYEYLIQEIADVRAQDELASDEVACRWVISTANLLLSLA
jgi:hypothetical protein